MNNTTTNTGAAQQLEVFVSDGIDLRADYLGESHTEARREAFGGDYQMLHNVDLHYWTLYTPFGTLGVCGDEEAIHKAIIRDGNWERTLWSNDHATLYQMTYRQALRVLEVVDHLEAAML